MKDMGKMPHIEKGTYRHYKGGIYEVIEIACNSETLEWYVIYRSNERKDTGLPAVWARPYAMFTEIIEINGKQVSRFEKVDKSLSENV